MLAGIFLLVAANGKSTHRGLPMLNPLDAHAVVFSVSRCLAIVR